MTEDKSLQNKNMNDMTNFMEPMNSMRNPECKTFEWVSSNRPNGCLLKSDCIRDNTSLRQVRNIYRVIHIKSDVTSFTHLFYIHISIQNPVSCIIIDNSDICCHMFLYQFPLIHKFTFQCLEKIEICISQTE